MINWIFCVAMVRRVFIVLLSLILVFPYLATGQELIKSKKRQFKLPEKATSLDYHSGIINI